LRLNLSATVTAHLEIVKNGIIESALQGAVNSNSAYTIVVSFANVPAGLYKLAICFDNAKYAFPNYNELLNVNVQLPAVTIAAPIISSYAGGKALTIAGEGFAS
jgi:hypothetical protein